MDWVLCIAILLYIGLDVQACRFQGARSFVCKWRHIFPPADPRQNRAFPRRVHAVDTLRDLWERPRPVRRISFVIFLIAVAALALIARVANVRDVFIEGAIYFIDADCYSRMTRVA